MIYYENKLKHVTDKIDLTVQNLPKVKKTKTMSIKENINDTWMSHIKTLLCQGHFFRLEEMTFQIQHGSPICSTYQETL